MFCPICNHTAKNLFKRSNQLGSVHMASNDRKSIDIILCTNCGFVWNNYAFSNSSGFEEWMSSAYKSYNLLNNSLHKFPLVDIRSVRAKEFIERNCDLASMKSIIEVGSNRGDFLAYLKQNYPNIQLLGVESSRLALVGVPTIFNDVSEINFSPSFDLVILRQVFEHISDPVKFLKHLSSFIKEDGYILIEVPDLENDLDDNIEPWVMEHVGFYSRESIEYLGNQIGLSVVAANRENQLLILLKKEDSKNSTQPVDSEDRENRIQNFNSKVERVSEEWKALLSEGYNLCFYGASNVFLAVSGVLEAKWGNDWNDLSKFLCDDYAEKHGKIINGIIVQSLDSLNPEEKYIFVLSAMYREHRKNMINKLKPYVETSDLVYEMWDKIDDIDVYINKMDKLTDITQLQS
jgi:SAM-dependent methyltransferase